MEKTGFCFNIDSIGEAMYNYSIGSKLEEKYGFEGHFVSLPSEMIYNALKDKKNVVFAPNFIDHPDDSNYKSDKKYTDYDLPENITFKLLMFSDYVLRDMPQEKAFKVIERYLAFWDDFFDKHKNIKFVFTFSTGCVIGRTAYCVAKKRGIYFFINDVLGKDLFISDMGENNASKKFIGIYELKKNTGLSESERQKVLSFVSSFREAGKMLTKPYKPTDKMNYRFKLLFAILLSKEKCPWARKKDIFKNYMMHLYSFFWAKYVLKYDRIRNDEKFIFFPIHVVFDSQILVRSPFFYNQAELVERIALSLPKDIKLYVKEHPGCIGNTPLEQIKQINKIENVRLLNPSTNSHDLIKRSEAVITISSTTGWEALLYEKPVIAFGNAFYSYSDLIYKCKNIEELPRLIKHALKDKDHYDSNKKLWESFIFAVLDASFPGKTLGAIVTSESALDFKEKPDEIEAENMADGVYKAYQYNLKDEKHI